MEAIKNTCCESTGNHFSNLFDMEFSSLKNLAFTYFLKNSPIWWSPYCLWVFTTFLWVIRNTEISTFLNFQSLIEFHLIIELEHSDIVFAWQGCLSLDFLREGLKNFFKKIMENSIIGGRSCKGHFHIKSFLVPNGLKSILDIEISFMYRGGPPLGLFKPP